MDPLPKLALTLVATVVILIAGYYILQYNPLWDRILPHDEAGGLVRKGLGVVQTRVRIVVEPILRPFLDFVLGGWRRVIDWVNIYFGATTELRLDMVRAIRLVT